VFGDALARPQRSLRKALGEGGSGYPIEGKTRASNVCLDVTLLTRPWWSVLDRVRPPRAPESCQHVIG